MIYFQPHDSLARSPGYRRGPWLLVLAPATFEQFHHPVKAGGRSDADLQYLIARSVEISDYSESAPALSNDGEKWNTNGVVPEDSNRRNSTLHAASRRE